MRADAPACNAANDVVESRRVVITGPGGEREEVIATETGPNTGVFRNLVGFPTVKAVAVNNDGRLQTAGSAVVTANYTDPDDSTDRSVATAQMIVSGSGKVIAQISAARGEPYGKRCRKQERFDDSGVHVLPFMRSAVRTAAWRERVTRLFQAPAARVTGVTSSRRAAPNRRTGRG